MVTRMPWYYMVLPFLLMGGYYAYFYLGPGKDRFQQAFRRNLGLRDGEQYHALYTGHFCIVRSKMEKVGEFVGQRTVGRGIQVALTNQNRCLVAYADQKDPPMTFDVGQVQADLSSRTGDSSKLMNSNGKQEAARVLWLHGNGVDLHIELAASSFDAVRTWASGGGVPPLPRSFGAAS